MGVCVYLKIDPRTGLGLKRRCGQCREWGGGKQGKKRKGWRTYLGLCVHQITIQMGLSLMFTKGLTLPPTPFPSALF